MTKFHAPDFYAEQWGVDADTIRGWCARGELVAVNVAKRADSKKPRWRISEDAAAEFLERRTRGPVPKATPVRSRRAPKSPKGVIEFF